MTEERAARYSDLFKDGPAEGEPAARYADLFEESHDHTPDCAYCPVCATIGVVRKTKPEIVDHLANAMRELMLAAGMFLEELGEAIGPDSETDPEAAAGADAEVPQNVHRIGPV